MSTLHLIVHKELLEQGVEDTQFSLEQRIAFQQVLDRISEVEKKEPEHDYLAFIGTNKDSELLDKVAQEYGIYEKVILYGHGTEICLEFIRRELERVGVEVRYDDEGTID